MSLELATARGLLARRGDWPRSLSVLSSCDKSSEQRKQPSLQNHTINTVLLLLHLGPYHATTMYVFRGRMSLLMNSPVAERKGRRAPPRSHSSVPTNQYPFFPTSSSMSLPSSYWSAWSHFLFFFPFFFLFFSPSCWHWLRPSRSSTAAAPIRT